MTSVSREGLPCTARRQETAMTDVPTATRISDVRTVGVPVTDQERALAFYGGVLGFETRMDSPFPGGRWIEVAARGATTSIALAAVQPGVSAGGDPRARVRRAHAAADHAALAAAGVDVDAEVLRFPGVPPMFS